MPIAAIWAAMKTGSFWLKALPYILGVLLIIGAIYACYSWSWDRGYHSRDIEVAKIAADRDTWKADAAGLTKAVDEQNLAVDAAKADGDARVKQGQEALAAVQKSNAGQAATIASLRAEAAKPHAADEPCIASSLVAGRKL
jgi:hypothetical protein